MRNTNKVLFFFIFQNSILPFPLPWLSNDLLVENLHVASGQLPKSPVQFRPELWPRRMLFWVPCKAVIASSDLWPQEMFTFLKMHANSYSLAWGCLKAVSVPSNRACACCHGRPAGFMDTCVLLPRQAVGLGAPQTIIAPLGRRLRGFTDDYQVYVCHRGHCKALSRCRLVGICACPGENFFPQA